MPPPTTIITVLFFTLLSTTTFSIILAQPDQPDPSPIPIQPQTQTFHRAPTTTIPAFPEQSDTSGCPLDLSEPFFQAIQSSCSVPKPKHHHHHHHQQESDPNQLILQHTRCCPVLAAWLYSAYSRTALSSVHKASGGNGISSPQTTSSSTYDMPVLPDDSETCVDALEKSLEGRNIELPRVNETCDAVYCWCGIRLRKFSCPEAFEVDARGRLVGNEAVMRLERECGGGAGASSNGRGGVGVCSRCLNSLYLLNEAKSGRANNSERTIRMQNHDCELMGLTWLLNKNRYAYINTVSAVLRALMTNPAGDGESSDDHRPTSCSLNSDDMPLAVDSSEINNQSSSTFLAVRYIFSLSFLFVSILFLFARH